ncbi:MAG: lipopolysaccharide biosynthesis protein [Nocardioidaceae bacterium]
MLGLIPWLMPTLADEQMITALLVLCAVCVAQFLVRGTLIGTRRMAQHGLILLLDAVLRLSLAAILVTTATRVTAGDFALALVCAIALAHLPVLVWARRAALRVSGRAEALPISPAGMARRVGHLITGSISSQILLNAPPIVVAAVASSGEADVVGRFAATFTLARLLLFIAVPLQSALVPGFTRLANAGDRRARRMLTARIGFGASALALLTGVLSWWVGPWAIDVVFGPRYGLGSRDVAFMVAGAALYLGLLVAAQALVGAGLHRLVGVTWTMALAVAIALFIVVPNLVLRVELGFAIGSAVGLVLALIFLWRATSARTQRPLLPS